MTQKIVIGMSGGVDSSAAALLLKQQGWDVIGVMLRLWAEDLGQDHKFCSDDAVFRAEQVAKKVGIPFYSPDTRDFFYQKVVTPFMDEYIAGRTPNPCILCNPFVRWVRLLEIADEMGASHIATGHYARLKTDGGSVHLFRGKDLKKDQSYVLAQLTPEQLSRTVFPLGELTKPEVRAIAAEYELKSADQPDSQDICFIADGDYRRFLRAYRGEKIRPGEIVNAEGRVIGSHEGLPFYTVGQRRGLNVYDPTPTYVLEKDISGNRLIVGKKEQIGKNVVEISQTNWLAPVSAEPFDASAQFRYKSKEHPVRVTLNGDASAVLELEEPLYDIACGQLAVIYKNGTEVLGSGIIQKTGRKE